MYKIYTGEEVRNDNSINKQFSIFRHDKLHVKNPGLQKDGKICFITYYVTKDNGCDGHRTNFLFYSLQYYL